MEDSMHDLLIYLLIQFSQNQESMLISERERAYAAPNKFITGEILQNRMVDAAKYIELLRVFELTIAY